MSASNWTWCPKCQSGEEPEGQQQFREDYEIYGADDACVVVDYSGHCQSCSAGLDFRMKRPF